MVGKLGGKRSLNLVSRAIRGLAGHGVAYVVITDEDATGNDLSKTSDDDDWGTCTSWSDQRFHTVWLTISDD